MGLEEFTSTPTYYFSIGIIFFIFTPLVKNHLRLFIGDKKWYKIKAEDEKAYAELYSHIFFRAGCLCMITEVFRLSDAIHPFLLDIGFIIIFLFLSIHVSKSLKELSVNDYKH